MKKVIILMQVVFFLLIVGCVSDNDEDANLKSKTEVKLSSTKDAISANGKDEIEFVVEVLDQNGEDLEASYKIYVNEEELESNIFTTEIAGEYEAYAKSGENISNKLQIEATREESYIESIELDSDKEKVSIDEEVKFTVAILDQYGEELEKEYQIYVNEEELESNIFTAEIAGEYEVYAKSGENISNKLQIEATREESYIESIELDSDKEKISIDEEVKFTVAILDQYGEELEKEYQIYVNEEELESNTFTAEIAGEYEVYAKSGENISNKLQIEAIKEESYVRTIKLISDKEEILADGEQEATFTVEILDQYEEVMEEEGYDIYVNDDLLEGNIFKTETPDEYTIYAKLGDVKSEEILLNAEPIAYEGDFTITKEMTQEYLDSIQKIDGDLFCEEDVVNFEMNNLVEITGGIYFRDLYQIEEFSLPKLDKLGESSEYDYIDYDRIYFSLRIADCYSLTDIDLGNLNEASSNIYLSGNSAMETVSFNNLESIGDSLKVFDMTNLKDITFENLNNISGVTKIYKNTNLKKIHMNNLESADNEISIYENSELLEIEMESLKTLEGYLRLKDLSKLESFKFSSLEKIWDSDEIYYEDYDLTGYDNNYISLWIEGCNNLEKIEFPSMETLDKGILIRNNSNFKIFNSSNLLTVGGAIFVMGNSIENFNLDKCSKIGNYFIITNEEKIKELTLPGLSEIEGKVKIYNNNLLESIVLENLLRLKSSIVIYDNSALKKIEMNRLIKAEGYMWFQNLPELTSIGLSNLNSVNGDTNLDYQDYSRTGYDHHDLSIDINNCDKLEIVKFPSLNSLAAGLFLKGNASLKEVSFPVIKSFGDSVWIFNNSLETINMPELVDVSNYFSVDQEDHLSKINLPKFSSCSGNFQFWNNQNLTEIKAPVLNSIDEDLYVKFNTIGGVLDLDDDVSVLGEQTIENGELQ